jgi:outer membrane protein TolC
MGLALALAVGCAQALAETSPAIEGSSGQVREAAAAARRSVPPSVPATEEEPLDLGQALRIALRNNPELRARRAEVGQAQAVREGASGAKRLELRGVGAYSHFLDPQRVIAARANGEFNAFSRDLLSQEVVLSLPLFTGGQLGNRIRASEFLETAAKDRLVRNREELIFNVTSLYYAILSQVRIVASLEFSLETLRQHRTHVLHLLDNQMAVKADLLRTEVRLADLEQRLVQQRNTLAVEAQLLANHLGVVSPGPGGLKVAGSLPRELTTATAHVSLEAVLNRRADYQAAVSEVRALERAAAGAKGALSPQVRAQASYGLRYGLDAEGPAGVDRSGDVGVIGVVVDLPILNGGRLRAKVREERARLEAATERLRKLELQVGLELGTAQSNLGSARQRVVATAKAVEQAQESYRLERQKYEADRGTIVDVLDAQSAQLELETNNYRAQADYQSALAQLRLAAGELQP